MKTPPHSLAGLDMTALSEVVFWLRHHHDTGEMLDALARWRDQLTVANDTNRQLVVAKQAAEARLLEVEAQLAEHGEAAE